MGVKLAVGYWRQKAHNYRVEKEKLMAINEALRVKQARLVEVVLSVSNDPNNILSLHTELVIRRARAAIEEVNRE
jgi:uncharacterized protein (UPF0147 family)